ncbi:MAG: GGDEF domain-containing protein [Burkholderiaceae bacterium]
MPITRVESVNNLQIAVAAPLTPPERRGPKVKSRRNRSKMMQPLLLVGGFSALYLFALQVFLSFGLISGSTLIFAGAAIGATLTLFFALFVSGWNRRANDRSLCLPMTLCGMAILLAIIYRAPATHLTFAPIVFTAIAFGSYRLHSRVVALLTALALAGFAAIVVVHSEAGINVGLVQAEWLSLLIVALFSPGFVLLSARVRKTNDSLFRAGVKIINIKETARRDPLIGCYNRRYTVDSLEQQKRLADEMGTDLCVALLDIDHFKRVNDQIGHLGGDHVLRSFGLTAQKFVRAGDVFGRYGGEEFLLILPDTDLHTALEISERIRAQVEQFPWDTRLPTGVTVSVGVTQYIGGESVLDLFSRTDSAMYLAKSGGRNQVVVEEPVFD